MLSDFCAAQLFKQIGFTNYKNGILSFWLPIFILTVGAAIAIIVSGFLFALYHLGYPGFRAVGDILLLFAVRIGFAVSFKLAENNLFVAPNIGSYVGGDITAGALVSMIWKDPEMSLFIDLGTIGELVLGNNDFQMSCACSAGPAFEGGDISCGMRATDGAVEACTIDKE